MADDALNQLAPGAGPASNARDAGGVPDRIRRRYFTDADAGAGPGLAFYVDAQTAAPAFRDRGRRLTTERNDPQIVRDLVAIARHRGWTEIAVRGQTGFRREAWITARAAGLEVRGYSPSARDDQDLARRLERAASRTGVPRDTPAPDRRPAGSAAPLEIVEAVVRARIVEPTAQARVIEAARQRIAGWLERGAVFAPTRPRTRDR